MRSLIIGMGIGQLYKDIYTKMGHDIVTVDTNPEKEADYTSVEDALQAYSFYDTVNICTPNFTHKEITEHVMSHANIVFVEKPGFKNAQEWHEVCFMNSLTRIMMVKNNMWRENIEDLRSIAKESESVELKWINKDRVPNPGTWFTTKELAYGGVSRDLMPHLLSLFAALEPDFINADVKYAEARQEWELSDLTRSDYGTVNPNGTYDVDDYLLIELDSKGRKFELISQWRSRVADERLIKFNIEDQFGVVAHLGLCPENAFQHMIQDAIAHKDDDLFWVQQYQIDMWIHEMIENA